MGIPMGTNCAPLVAGLFLFCYEIASCCIFLTITKQMLLNHLILPQAI